MGNYLSQETANDLERRDPWKHPEVNWAAEYRTESQLLFAAGLREDDQAFIGASYPDEPMNEYSDAIDVLEFLMLPDITIVGPRYPYFLREEIQNRQQRSKVHMLKKLWNKEILRCMLIASGMPLEQVLYLVLPMYWEILHRKGYKFEVLIANRDLRAKALDNVGRWADALLGAQSHLGGESPFWELGQDIYISHILNKTRTLGEFLMPTQSLWKGVQDAQAANKKWEKIPLGILIQDVVEYLDNKYSTKFLSGESLGEVTDPLTATPTPGPSRAAAPFTPKAMSTPRPTSSPGNRTLTLADDGSYFVAVSYTHLTLPTILLV